jgi:hypothetical protein
MVLRGFWRESTHFNDTLLALGHSREKEQHVQDRLRAVTLGAKISSGPLDGAQMYLLATLKNYSKDAFAW